MTSRECVIMPEPAVVVSVVLSVAASVVGSGSII